jgi:hypothetical protein
MAFSSAFDATPDLVAALTVIRDSLENSLACLDGDLPRRLACALLNIAHGTLEKARRRAAPTGGFCGPDMAQIEEEVKAAMKAGAKVMHVGAGLPGIRHIVEGKDGFGQCETALPADRCSCGAFRIVIEEARELKAGEPITWVAEKDWPLPPDHPHPAPLTLTAHKLALRCKNPYEDSIDGIDVTNMATGSPNMEGAEDDPSLFGGAVNPGKAAEGPPVPPDKPKCRHCGMPEGEGHYFYCPNWGCSPPKDFGPGEPGRYVTK